MKERGFVPFVERAPAKEADCESDEEPGSDE
jgi:hypothetical protein